jgi:transcriptional regulator GlxA family with amidase domain
MTASRKLVEIGVLEYPGAQAAAVHGLVDLIETAQRVHEESGARGARLSARRLPAEDCAKETPDKPLAALVLPPSLGNAADAARPRGLASWIVRRHREGTLLSSVCAGAFLLAETGLLDGRPATTHWALRARFAERFPNVQLDTQKILIDDGDIVTAGGVMAWVDLGLMLIARFLGPTAMLATARLFVVDPGGREQRFYDCFAPVLTHGDDAILRVQHLLHAKREKKIDLKAMARVAKLSERTFLRRFHRATGFSPMEYLQLLRVERARELLERSVRSFDEIAFGLGYSDPGSFRRVFVSVMGLTVVSL